MHQSNYGYLYLTQQKIEELLVLYESHRELWDTSLPVSNKMRLRVPAFIEIAKALNVDRFGPTEVNMKIRYLRNRYGQERKKVIMDENHVPPMKWYAKMDSFLRPHIKLQIHEKKKKKQNNDQPGGFRETTHSSAQSSDSILSSILFKSEPPESHETVDQEISKEWSEGSSISPPIKTETPDVDDSDPNKDFYAEVPGTHEGYDESIPKSMKPSERLKELKPVENTYDKFGLYIASLLREMPKKNTLLLQPQIVNVITVAMAEEMAEKTTSET